MGASSSTSRAVPSPELEEQESLAATTVSLSSLRAAFAHISGGENFIDRQSLQQAFSVDRLAGIGDPEELARIVPHLGPSIAELAFASGEEVVGVDWLGFLRLYNRICARVPASSSLALIYRVYSSSLFRAGLSCGFEFEIEDGDDSQKVGGSLKPMEVLVLFCICWIFGQWPEISRGGDKIALPCLDHILRSAFFAGGVLGSHEDVWGLDLLGLEKRIQVQKMRLWILGTVPGIASCLSQFVQNRIRNIVASEDGIRTSIGDVANVSSVCSKDQGTYLLTTGRAWGISLSMKSNACDEVLRVLSPGANTNLHDNLLYRSSVHGKGLSRFWYALEGYHGPLLVLFSSGTRGDSVRKWIIGVLTEQGFENREAFYGSSAHLYAVDPIFNVISPLGKEKNFMYCHLHPTAKMYEPNPKPVGLAFGGSIGNERIFIDEDFSKVTIRHHAVDKTYQNGSLIPNQGFLAVESTLSEVEVWGLGGNAAKREQDSYKRREVLFSEQRRKVDLKTFGSWEDSPEKMMMNMVSDPNRVRREDR